MQQKNKTLIPAICIAAALSVALWAPHSAKAAAASLPSLDPCRMDDGSFTSTDAGCRDNATGLVWSTGSCEGGLGITPTNVSWKYWSAYVRNSTFGGHKWRLPTKAELLTLSSDDASDGNGSMTHIGVTDYKYAQSNDAYKNVHWTVRLGDGDAKAWDYAGEGLAVRVN